MEPFFSWLSTPGPWEEITLLVFALVFAFGVPFWIKKLKIKKVGKGGLEFGGDEKAKEDTSKPTESNTSASEKITNQVSYATAQDHRIFSLILKDFSSKMKSDIKDYCRKNGIDKKSDLEYNEYAEEKKYAYYNSLKEKFQEEYTSYDIVSIDDVEKILESLRDFTFNKIENVYKKIRAIAIEEHRFVTEEYEREYETFKNNMNSVANLFKENKELSAIVENQINSVLQQHYTKYKEIVIYERINILDKEIRVVEDTNKTISRRFIEEFDKIFREKSSK